MAELIIIRTLLRCWTVSDSEEGFNLVLGRDRNATLLLNKSGWMLLLQGDQIRDGASRLW
jgi:hypothetical protein